MSRVDNHADVDETKKMHLRRYLDLGRFWLQMASAGKLILLKKMTMVLKGAHSFSIFLVMPARNPIGTRCFFQLYEVVPHSWITFSILLSLINSHRFTSKKQMIWDVFFIHIIIHPRNFHRILGIQEMPHRLRYCSFRSGSSEITSRDWRLDGQLRWEARGKEALSKRDTGGD